MFYNSWRLLWRYYYYYTTTNSERETWIRYFPLVLFASSQTFSKKKTHQPTVRVRCVQKREPLLCTCNFSAKNKFQLFRDKSTLVVVTVLLLLPSRHFSQTTLWNQQKKTRNRPNFVVVLYVKANNRLFLLL